MIKRLNVPQILEVYLRLMYKGEQGMQRYVDVWHRLLQSNKASDEASTVLDTSFGVGFPGIGLAKNGINIIGVCKSKEMLNYATSKVQ